MIRMRHYTRKSSKDKILIDNRIEAQDQNKVFVEHATADPYSPRDAEARYRLKRGKGNAYVEFDANEDEIEEQKNSLTGKIEYFLRGDVDLTDRDSEGFDNV
jgi:HYD1 signature containing ADP-ribosyltransferase